MCDTAHTKVTYILSSFLSVNVVNSYEQLETIAKSVWENFDPHIKFQNGWIPIEMTGFHPPKFAKQVEN